MKSILIMALLLTSTVSSFAADVTRDQAVSACNALKGVLPVEDENIFTSPKYMSFCLRQMTFEVKEKRGAFILLEANGQTLEDMQTVCQVVIKQNPLAEIAVPTPVCEIM